MRFLPRGVLFPVREVGAPLSGEIPSPVHSRWTSVLHPSVGGPGSGLPVGVDVGHLCL